MVVMRSGQHPSEMVMRALLWGQCHTPSGMSQALSLMSTSQGRAHPGKALTPAELSFPPSTCPGSLPWGAAVSPPAPAGSGGGQGWACGSLHLQAGQAAGPSSPPACPYLFSYPLNSLSFLRGEEQGGWSGPGEPGAGDARDPKSYLANDAADLLQRQRQGWPRQRAAPCLPHPSSAPSLADGQWAGPALWPLEHGVASW